VLTPQMIGLKQAAALPFASSLCGACGDVCPVKIKLPEMLLHLRHEVKEGKSVSSLASGKAETENSVSKNGFHHQSENTDGQSAQSRSRERVRNMFEHLGFKLWALAMSSSRRYEAAGRLARMAQAVLGRSKAKGARALTVPGWTSTRDFPPLPERSFRDQWAEKN
jgi:L-lactate dehydrogenase complex protein LldF